MKTLGKILLIVLIVIAAFAALWAIAPIQMTLFLGASLVTIYAITIKIIKLITVVAVILLAIWLVAKVIKK